MLENVSWWLNSYGHGNIRAKKRRARCRHGVGVNEVSRGMVRRSPNVFDQALQYINTPNYSDVMELRAWVTRARSFAVHDFPGKSGTQRVKCARDELYRRV